MKDKSLLTTDYRVTSFLSNPYGKLGLYGLLNLLQDIASDHATMLGFGFDDMVRMKTFWVLTRQKVLMNRWPVLGEKVTIKTWVRLGEGALSHRDFSLFVGDEKVGECSTAWITLHSETRRPVMVDRSGVLSQLTAFEKVSVDPEKISVMKEELQDVAKFSVRNSDIDLNMHVNNTKYAQWILFLSLPMVSMIFKLMRSISF
jgi:medium-chain acyl-[acyl-carrier-protein] hydrolase